MMAISLHEILLTSGAAFLLAAGAHDVATRTIPHWAVAGIAVSGLLLRLAEGGLASSCITAGCVLAVAVLLWGAGWMGGGDAKLLGSIALLVPPGSILPTLSAVAIFGAALALPYILLRGRLDRPVPTRRSMGLFVRSWRAERFRLRRGGPLPYGVAIALGAVLNLWSAGA